MKLSAGVPLPASGQRQCVRVGEQYAFSTTSLKLASAGSGCMAAGRSPLGVQSASVRGAVLTAGMVMLKAIAAISPIGPLGPWVNPNGTLTVAPRSPLALPKLTWAQLAGFGHAGCALWDGATATTDSSATTPSTDCPLIINSRSVPLAASNAGGSKPRTHSAPWQRLPRSRPP